jgi:hypothetical protein
MSKNKNKNKATDADTCPKGDTSESAPMSADTETCDCIRGEWFVIDRELTAGSDRIVTIPDGFTAVIPTTTGRARFDYAYIVGTKLYYRLATAGGSKYRFLLIK